MAHYMSVSEAGRHVTKFLELFIDVLLEAKKKGYRQPLCLIGYIAYFLTAATTDEYAHEPSKGYAHGNSRKRCHM